MSEEIKKEEVLEEGTQEKKVEQETVEEKEEVEKLEEESEHWEEDEVETLEKEVKQWKDAYIRKVAEFENLKKRVAKEKEEFLKFASEKLIVKVLEAVDNLERGIEASKATQDFDSLVKGVEMTLNQMHKILNEEGVEQFDSLGKPFDPYEHHAMMQEETDEHDDNTVMQEFQKGYKMKEKVIRPAMVKVSKKTK